MSITRTTNDRTHGVPRRVRGPRKSRSVDAKVLTRRTVPGPKIRFYFEESNGSLTPVYGNRTFPTGPPVGFVQTTDNHHGPAPQHPIFSRRPSAFI